MTAPHQPIGPAMSWESLIPAGHPFNLWNRGLFLHASAVVLNDKVLLCLGHSGAGKSSIARLLSDRLPVLADDIVFITFDGSGQCHVKDGRFRVRNRTSGDPTEITEREHRAAPEFSLGYVARLHQAATPRLERLRPIKACRHLVDAAFEVDLQRTLIDLEDEEMDGWSPRYFAAGLTPMPPPWRWAFKEKLFHYAAAMARRYPAWELHFALNAASAEMIVQQW